MNIVVQIYMIVCVVLLIFDIFFLFVKNYRNQRYYPKVPKFEEKIREQIEQKERTGEFSEGFLAELSKKAKKTKYLLALNNVLDGCDRQREWFRQVVFDLIGEYQKKSDYEQAYYAYVVSVFNYESDKLPGQFAYEFQKFLDSKSLYTFTNAMNAIYRFGDLNVLMYAVGKVDERNGFYHEKLFVDGMLSARVNSGELGEILIQRFDTYKAFTKKCILDYLRLSGYDAADFCMKLIKNSKEDDELHYAAIRFFIKYPDEKSKEYFMSILSSTDSIPWVDEMMAIQGLGSYYDEKVMNAIRIRITSSNWYIRSNAAAYLRKHNISKEEIGNLIRLNDKYANEALIYEYKNDDEMLKYISKLIEEVREEADA